MKIRTLISGSLTFLIGCSLVYFVEPWIEGHIDGWFFTESAPRSIAMLGLLATFGLSGYISARGGKTSELRWGLVWTLVTTIFVAGVTFWGGDAMHRRLPTPSIDQGWNAIWLTAFYCLAPIVCASAAQDANRKQKKERAELVADTVAEAAQEAVETVHEIFKHH